METGIPFATNLVLRADEEPNARALELIQGFRTSPSVWVLEGLDATGSLGNTLTKEINQSAYKVVPHEEFCRLLGEDGQVIELEALALGEDHELLAQVVIADGSIVDWLGFGDPAEEASPGDFQRLDCKIFDWPRSAIEALGTKALLR